MRVGVMLAMILCAATVAACGGSGSHNRKSARSVAGVKFAQCMRTHGVSGFPDPTSGSGAQFQSTGGVNPFSPRFQAAQKACRKLMPGGGPSAGAHATAAQKAQMVSLSRCMRAHGVSGFPDPVTSAPSNPAGMRLAFGRPGSFIVITDRIDIQSPAFRRAARACEFPGLGRPGKASAAP